MNININVNITVQQPEVQTFIRLPATTVETRAPREDNAFEYMQHRQRMYEKIKRLFGHDAGLQYLAGTV